MPPLRHISFRLKFSASCIKRTNNLAEYLPDVNHHVGMQDKSIDGALRKQIIREKRDGLAHVEALLVLRSVHMPRVKPAKRPDVARCGYMTHIVQDALSDGPRTAREVSEYVSARRTGIDFDAVHKRTALALTKLKNCGLVVHDGKFGGLWRLAP